MTLSSTTNLSELVEDNLNTFFEGLLPIKKLNNSTVLILPLLYDEKFEIDDIDKQIREHEEAIEKLKSKKKKND